ncbi:MAG: hypothetical protein ABJA60_11405 [Nitrosospira sp.]
MGGYVIHLLGPQTGGEPSRVLTVPRMPNLPVCQQRSRNWPIMRIGYINVSPGQIWRLERVEPGGASSPVVVRGPIVTNNDK